jgi:hypothetical protein
MDLNITNFRKENPDIFPIIDELVNSLYTDDINNLIHTKCKTIDDKRVFLMFLIMYFYTYLNIYDLKHTPDNTKSLTDNTTHLFDNTKNILDTNVKKELKLFLTDIIRNPNKRKLCLELYTSFEKSISLLKN